MKTFLSLLTYTPYFDLPEDWSGWAGLLILVALNLLALWRWRKYTNLSGKRVGLNLAGLLVATVLTALFLGFRLPPESTPPYPGVPKDTIVPAVMLLAAIPWMLAAGLWGPLPAAIFALVSGLLQALFDTHSLFYPFELSLLAIIFAASVRQSYRTQAFRILRNPLAAASLLIILYPFLILLEVVTAASGILTVRLGFALTLLGSFSLTQGIILLVGALAALIFRSSLGLRWGGRGGSLPSPAEKSLQARFLWGIAPLAVVLVIILVVGDWWVAGNSARDMLQRRMINTAELTASTVPYFLETGQNLISQMADDPRLYSSPQDDLQAVLEEKIRSVPFFRQIYLFDKDGNVLAGYPTRTYINVQAPLQEQYRLHFALTALHVQSYSLPPAPGEQVAQVGFLSSIADETGMVRGVLMGRSDLASNPLTQPVLNSLNSLTDIDGQGILLDEDGRILYHPDPALVMTLYPMENLDREQPASFPSTSLSGIPEMAVYRQVVGRDWSVVVTVPEYQAQQLSLKIASPLLGLILLLSIAAVLGLHFGLKRVTGSLQTLALEAGHISQGQLDRPLVVTGEDEVGLLRKAFEQMRGSLKARLDELNRLLLVSQGVASSLEFADAVQPVLESALSGGACSARVVLTPNVVPELDGKEPGPISYGAGKLTNAFAYLDEQILALNHQQERVALTNLSRPRLFQIPAAAPRPDGLLAVALRHENRYYGTLWVAYDQPHLFREEEVRFLTTLAGQAALAAANARLFLNAEIGRQRLAAILASTPDPVLVTDQHDQLILSNPAAWHALGINIDGEETPTAGQVIPSPELKALLSARPYNVADETQSAEVCLADGRVYLATASSVLAEGQRVGRVCVLRDVTHFKELDALKSEFVSTVSHDLRSPLTLMRGYATMLEMVGELNEQQTNYVRKIVTGVESMSRLVTNLLDLGRIEASVGLQVELISVHEVLDKVVNTLQGQATQKQIQLSVDISRDNTAVIEADQALLQQALHNLVENAIKYTRAQGKVIIRMETHKEGRVTFSIHDSGIGIAPMDQPRVFEKFYRAAQQGAREQRGTGLGLAIVKSIAEKHGGKVWVESQLGKGSTFFLEVPIRQTRLAIPS